MSTQHASGLHGQAASDDDLPAALDALVRDKLADAATPGFEVEFDPHEAEHAGAFVEDALGTKDAADSTPEASEADAALVNPARAGGPGAAA